VVPRYDLPKAAPEPLRLVQRFVNTVDLDHRREWLSTPAELEAWCAEHDLPLDGPVSESGLRRAIDVREALRALARANNGLALDPDATATLNHALVAARVEVALDATGAPRLEPHAQGVDGALGRILATFVEATLDGTWARLKSCRHCRWAFYDYSSNRSARWCSMELCGNRRKTRAYRGRRKAEHRLG
jgi:predicted RNA-binding Zn ribbon-like protein